jgi:hypothetical protein
MEKIRIRYPGWKKVGSGIRDKHPECTTLDDGTHFDGAVFHRLPRPVLHEAGKVSLGARVWFHVFRLQHPRRELPCSKKK